MRVIFACFQDFNSQTRALVSDATYRGDLVPFWTRVSEAKVRTKPSAVPAMPLACKMTKEIH